MICDLNVIGNRLLRFRKRMAMTQAEVAEAAGISDRSYADIERGTVNMRLLTFLQICHVLHVTPNEILLGENTEVESSQKEILEKLNHCTQKDKDIAYKLLDVYLKGVL